MIQIDGDKVKIIQQVVEREVTTVDFLKELANQTPIYFPVMPQNLKGLISSNNISFLIVEQAPRTQLVNWSGQTGTGRFPIEFQIHLPWVYFVLSLRNNPLAIEHIQLFFAKNSVTEEDSPVGWMMLPNVKYNSSLAIGEMCGGEMKVKDNQTLPCFVADLIAQLWGTLFNKDHVSVGNDGAELIRAEMAKYLSAEFAKKSESAENEADKKRFSILANEEGARYLYAWEALSQEISLPEFVKKLELRHRWTYKKTLEGIRNQIVRR